jgi:hypothetical protein
MTMKHPKAVLSMAVVTILLILIAPAHALMINLSTSNTTVIVGDSFDVVVSVYDDGALGDLTSFGFDVGPFCSSPVLSYTGYRIADEFWDVSDTVSNPANVSGLYTGPFEDPNQPGTFVGNSGTDAALATLFFDTSSIGNETIEISGIYDGLFSGLFYELGGDSISASLDISVAPVPEPGTFVLLFTGLAGVLGIKKKRMRRT